MSHTIMTDKPIHKKPKRLTVAAICRRLAGVFGPVCPPPKGPVLDELIATILSQNTSDANSGAAFEELCRRFPDWDSVRRAPVARIAKAIQRAGLSRQKAPRIKAILDEVYRERGGLSLDFVCGLATREAIDYLSHFPGVGPKTVACVLLFACGKPVLPVDTHVHRVSGRLGLIGPKVDANKAHEELAKLVPPHRVLDFHIQLIRHGRQVCLASRPRCQECVLLDRCPEGHQRLSGQAGLPDWSSAYC
jgi:endonuclease III